MKKQDPRLSDRRSPCALAASQAATARLAHSARPRRRTAKDGAELEDARPNRRELGKRVFGRRIWLAHRLTGCTIIYLVGCGV